MEIKYGQGCHVGQHQRFSCDQCKTIILSGGVYYRNGDVCTCVTCTPSRSIPDRWVEAVRQDPCVGKGSCTSIDETMDDNDLALFLVRNGAKSVNSSIRLARKMEIDYLERACEARWGEDTDQELVDLREFRKKCRTTPVTSK